MSWSMVSDEMCKAVTASSKVWTMPELVTLIVRGTGWTDWARLCRLNKVASEAARARLYSGHYFGATIRPLLSILAPMERIGDSGFMFTRPLETSDWTRFLGYSKHVIYMYFSDDHMIAPETFCVMDATRPPQDIFPSLRDFADMRVSPCSNYLHNMTFHKRLREFRIRSWIAPLRLLQTLRKAANSLRKLELGTYTMVPDKLTIVELLALIPELHSIDTLSLPSLFVTSDVFDALSRSVSLQEFHLLCSEFDRNPPPPDNSLHYAFRLPADGFSKLCSLTIEHRSPRPHSLLLVTGMKPNMTRLSVQFSCAPDFTGLKKYHAILSGGFSSLTELFITVSQSAEKHEISDSGHAFGLLQPLLVLEHLENFSFNYNAPVSLKDEHIEKMAQAWPLLQYFVFCSDVFYDVHQTELTLACLLSFAEHCPRIDFLMFAIDTTLDPPRQPTDDTVFPPNFSTLTVTNSPILDITSVATYIADLLPISVRLECAVHLDFEGRDIDRSERWESAILLVDALHQASARSLRRSLRAPVSLTAKA
ncbi:hypothetical protein SISSUDRAFT_1128577 [Sistotremastrum suecicum HHB10207 ss-3]|uniref:F-box domain-containing protein n=1 Tax=Sistotremastrum suecicum HHB10207 ss-3 TaxID=1314776 RepID=A0A166DMN8_9AGAM|nr:hypothetical protein SISSUDRAFT_1128577 [Sistotremastrum suecicum HHB10207 ss-3]